MHGVCTFFVFLAYEKMETLFCWMGDAYVDL